LSCAGPLYEPDDAGVDPDPEDAAPPERGARVLRLAGLVRGLGRAAVEREREAVFAARERVERDAAAGRVLRPDGIAAATPPAAPRATPVTARPAVSTPATP
jgi:hypothetical protein